MSGETPFEPGGPSGGDTPFEPGGASSGTLGYPRVHLRRTGSTNERARELAIGGAPHGTLVTATEQTAGRGRQGRAWSAPPASSLLCSLVLRGEPPAPLSLLAGVAVCDAVGPSARVKWPNDVVLERAPVDTMPSAAPGESQATSAYPPTLAKLAGILVEGRPQEGWAVLGIGVNVAVRVEDLPEDVRGRAATLGLRSSAIEPLLADLLAALSRRLSEPVHTLLDAWRARDALHGREISWAASEPGSTQDAIADDGAGSESSGDTGSGSVPRMQGRAQGIDGEGRLLVRVAGGDELTTLAAGEVHLGSWSGL